MQDDSLLRAARDYLAFELRLGRCGLSRLKRASAQHRLQQSRQRLRRQLDQTPERTASAIYHRILVAADATSMAKVATRLAAKLAREFNADMAIVHVVDTSTLHSTQGSTMESDARDDAIARARDWVKRLARRASPLVASDQWVREGFAAAEILAAAQQWNADLIVMGNRGHGRLARFLVGSTTESVIRHSRIPVLVAPQEGAASFAESSAVVVDARPAHLGQTSIPKG